MYSEELHEAVNRVVDSGWYLQGNENKTFGQTMPTILAPLIV